MLAFVLKFHCIEDAVSCTYGAGFNVSYVSLRLK